MKISDKALDLIIQDVNGTMNEKNSGQQYLKKPDVSSRYFPGATIIPFPSCSNNKPPTEKAG
ncbi:MAG: hypothetical protein V3V12_01475 [Gammaproteobacteria bacterium]